MQFEPLSAIFAPAIGAIITFILIAATLKFDRLRFAIDQPNERSLHNRPVPRTGGAAIMLGIVAAFLWLGWAPGMLALALALAVVSLVDDRRGLPIGVRLAAHVLAAAVFGVIWLGDTWPAVFCLLSIVAVIWITNLYNFMDGADGLAGGMAVFGFGAYAIALFAAGQAGAAAATLSIALAAGSFLLFNFHPARVFMGDAGSIPLGFLAATIGLLGVRDGVWPIGFPLLVFSPFIIDATLTIVRRALRGERFWQAHRTHYYQRLVQLGWGHRRTALAEYALMSACACIALWTRTESIVIQIAALTAVGIGYVRVAVAVDRTWAQVRPDSPA